MNICTKMLLGAGILLTAASAGAQNVPLERSVDGNRAALTRLAPRQALGNSYRFYRPVPRPANALDGAIHCLRTPELRAAAPARNAASADMPSIKGVLMNSDAWMSTGFDRGLYNVPTADGQEFTKIWSAESSMETTYSGVLIDDVLYTHDYENYYGFLEFYYVKAFDYATGEEVFRYESAGWDIIASGVAQDPVSGEVYGIFYNAAGNAMNLMKIVYSTPVPQTTLVAPLEGSWITMAISPEGEIYGIRIDSEAGEVAGSTLCKINKADGTVTEVGPTGQVPLYPCGATFDPNTGRMFWAVSDDSTTPGKLVEVNTETGATTLVTAFPNGEEVNSLIIEKVINPAAPAAAEEFTVVCEPGSRDLTFKVKAPSTKYDGTEATGALTATIDVNGETFVTEATSYGAEFEISRTVAVSGMTNFGITFADGEISGPRTTQAVYVGHSEPSEPNVMVVAGDTNNGKVTLRVSWTGADVSVDGGYIDPTQISYKLFRMPAHEEIALTDSGDTFFSEEVDDPILQTEYQYAVGVTYISADNYYKETLSNVLTLGTRTPPYINTFDNDLSIEDFTIIDANGDGKKWYISNGSLRMAYNSSKAMDDWAITPALMLEAGKNYRITLDAHHTSGYNERFEVKYGTAPTAEAMTETAIEPSDVVTSEFAPFEGVISPSVSGKYYVGIHGISDEDKYYLDIDNLCIEAGTTTAGPDQVTDLVGITDPSGELNAVLTFKAPTTDQAGGELTAIEKIEIKRGLNLVHTIESPAPGAELSYTDPVGTGGDVTYTVTAFANGNPGKAASVTVFVGNTYPVAPATVSAVETANEGEVTVSWDPVTLDEYGAAIPASKLTYAVYIFYGTSRKLVAENLTETSHTAVVVEPGDQQLLQFAVFARNDIGEGEGQLSNFVQLGTPYTDFCESFPGGLVSYDMGIRRISGQPQWSLLTDASGVPSYDGDNGFIGMQASAVGDAAAIYTGKISLVGMTNPGLTFATYNLQSNDGATSKNVVTISVGIAGQEGLTEVFSGQVDQIAPLPMEWGKVAVDLSEYAGQVIYLDIAATCNNMAFTLLDQIKVSERYEREMAVTAIEAPEKLNPGQAFSVLVRFENMGTAAASDWTLDLYRNDEKVSTHEGYTLEAGVGSNYTFDQYLHELEEEDVVYHAVLNYEGDGVPENNISERITIKNQPTPYPAVSDLRGELVAEGVRLSWTEPALEVAVPVEVTEDIEGADSFADTLEGWTLIDRDNSAVGGFQGTEIPNHAIGGKAGFFVFDAGDDYPQFNLSFAAASGSKYLASLFRLDGQPVDDWAISPEVLGGSAVSFKARSYSASYPEKLEILYSTGSLDPADFVSLETVASVPGEWTLYTVNLPEDAARFAIRSCAADAFMLMVDDIAYTPAAALPSDLTVRQYNIYRNGEHLAGVVSGQETAYTDTTAPEGTNAYRVVTIWNHGLSAGSNTVTVEVSGLNGIGTAEVTVTAAKGSIRISGAETAATVSAADGRVWYSGATPATVAVPAGVYLVSLPGKTIKVVVR